jgi:hypothetical protein
MYQTRLGSFDGNHWEGIMQLCFRLKYESEHYQSVPASSGDCGIEGYTKTGKVFQCYCPDNNMSSKDLYDKQRDKITRDLAKLKLYEGRLKKFLEDTKIKEWIFVTPEYRMNDLLIHCNTKRQELIQENLSIIDPSFQVIVHDINNFLKELPIALNVDQNKLYIGAEKGNTNVTEWKTQSIDLASNAVRKHNKRFPAKATDVDKKVNTLTDLTIQSFLDRETILQRWQQLHQEDYDKFLILIGQIEKEIQEKCMFPAEDNNRLYVELREIVRQRLKQNFGYLSDMTIENLTHGAIADWLLRCPLDFE